MPIIYIQIITKHTNVFGNYTDLDRASERLYLGLKDTFQRWQSRSWIETKIEQIEIAKTIQGYCAIEAVNRIGKYHN